MCWVRIHAFNIYCCSLIIKDCRIVVVLNLRYVRRRIKIFIFPMVLSQKVGSGDMSQIRGLLYVVTPLSSLTVTSISFCVIPDRVIGSRGNIRITRCIPHTLASQTIYCKNRSDNKKVYENSIACSFHNFRLRFTSKAAPAPRRAASRASAGSHPGIVVRAMLRSQGREPGGFRIAGPVSVRPRGRTCRILQISGPLPDGVCRETVAGGRRCAYDAPRNG